MMQWPIYGYRSKICCILYIGLVRINLAAVLIKNSDWTLARLIEKLGVTLSKPIWMDRE